MKKISISFASAFVLTGYCSGASLFIDVGRVGNSTSATGYNNITDSFANGVIEVSDPDSDNIFTPTGVVQPSTPLALVDTTGATTGFSVNVFTQNMPNDEIAEAGAGGDFPGIYPAVFGGIEQTALQDGLFLRDEQGDEFLHFVFLGLSSSESYTFSIYGARPTNGRVTNIELTDGINGSSLGMGSYNPEGNSTDVVTFSDLVPDSNGEITLKVNAPATSGSGTVNFIQIDSETIPEPSSIALISLAGLGLLIRRRRSD